MHKSADSHGETIDFFYLKDTVRSQSISVSFFAVFAAVMVIYSYIRFWGVPASPDEFLELLAFSGSVKLQLAAVVAAFIAVICSAISYFTRRSCYVEFKETALCAKLPAFPLRTEYIEVPYKDITGIKRVATKRAGYADKLIINTRKGRILIPHESATKIRKIENLLYELKG